ncbi:hypothetical protein PIB30_007237 [Stylosanthes scabra]|uniref:Uncharacterized protein n=1 Tax=Stylosanthes scabra TaxID=79078 RepID=A0ABU6V4U5_9FABA|nr:hypothetical protein [Stylosanthes scabra]
MGTDVLFFDSDFNPDMPYDMSLSELHPGGGQYSFPPYPMNVAKPEPDLPMPQMPEYSPWFDPTPEPIIPYHPIPAAPPPSSKVIELSSDESFRAWIDQMMTEMYWTSFDSGYSGSSSSSSSVSVVSDELSSQY